MPRLCALSALFALLLPLLAAGLHGAEFAALLDGTPHEVVAFSGAPRAGASPPPRLDLAVSTHGHDLLLALEKHDALFAPGYEHVVIHRNGSVVSREPLSEHCIYRGRLYRADDSERANEIGDALVSVCDGEVEGRLRIGATHNLAVAPHPRGDGRHAVFHSHHWGESTRADEWTCGVSDDEEEDHNHRPMMGDAVGDRQRRRLLNGNVNKYVELIVVNDYARCQAFVDDGKTLGDMTTRSAGIVAVVDGLYKAGYTAAPFFACVLAPTASSPLALHAGQLVPGRAHCLLPAKPSPRSPDMSPDRARRAQVQH